ncbi:AAA family ATPase [bacterium]|nr:AAA family ATPase [bacterium]
MTKPPIASPTIPADWPPFARTMAERYYTHTVSQFVLHGAVRDLLPVPENGATRYVPLEEFLLRTLFARRHAVIFYDRSRGLTIPNPDAFADFHSFLHAYEGATGAGAAMSARIPGPADAVGRAVPMRQLPADPPTALRLVERYIRTRAGEGKGVALVIDYAEQIAPAGDVGSLSDGDRASLVALRRFARDPAFLSGDVTVVLVTEQLAELSRHLVANPFTAVVEMDLPDEAARRRFIEHEIEGRKILDVSDVPLSALAQTTAGLALTHVRQVIAEPLRLGRRITFDALMRRKKELIEAECHGLVEFIEPHFSLDMVAGCAEAKAQLRTAARLLKAGHRDVLPMGWLVCGPVGTGKTFLATCFTGEIGVPCVKILNIRSQWVGQTEANLQKLLTVFRALGPLGVIVDEADAFFGTRAGSGDSGVSSRVFSAFASFMSDTAHRGRILWFLLTARPDLLPVDLKRQGRAEEHIALFPPTTAAEREEFFAVFCKKNDIATKLSPAEIEEIFRASGHAQLSGADLEAVTIRAKSLAAARVNGESHRKDAMGTDVHRKDAMGTDVHREDAMGTDVHREDAKIAKKKASSDTASRDVILSEAKDPAPRKKTRLSQKAAVPIDVTREDFEQAFEDFLPPVYGEEVEYQTLTAVLECTSRRLIPEPWKSMPRDAVARRLHELELLLGAGMRV